MVCRRSNIEILFDICKVLQSLRPRLSHGVLIDPSQSKVMSRSGLNNTILRSKLELLRSRGLVEEMHLTARGEEFIVKSESAEVLVR